MKYLRTFATENAMNNFQPDYNVLKGNKENNKIAIYTHHENNYTMIISANGDGQIIVNKGINPDSLIMWGDYELIRMQEKDKTIDGITYYAYDDWDWQYYITKNIKGDYTQEPIYEYNESENLMELYGNEDITINVSDKSDKHRQQLLYYTNGENQILTSNTEILNVYPYNINSNTLTSIIIPDTVSSIEDYAFMNYEGLTSVTIGNSVTSIGTQAFNNCSGLTSVTIPNSVTTIGDNAFTNCKGITNAVIGNSVTSIGMYAFSECYSLTNVTIGNSVETIGIRTFNGCYNLTGISIPNSVISIGIGAFHSCLALTNITFEGTSTQWNAITKGNIWHEYVPATVVHCTDGDVDINI